MTMHCGIGILTAKFGDELDECRTLCRCASIFGRLAVDGAAADVADADGMGIVTHTMCPSAVDVTSFVYRPIEVNHVVIADAVEAPLAMP